jgi:hypothetical protein
MYAAVMGSSRVGDGSARVTIMLSPSRSSKDSRGSGCTDGVGRRSRRHGWSCSSGSRTSIDVAVTPPSDTSPQWNSNNDSSRRLRCQSPHEIRCPLPRGNLSPDVFEFLAGVGPQLIRLPGPVPGDRGTRSTDLLGDGIDTAEAFVSPRGVARVRARPGAGCGPAAPTAATSGPRTGCGRSRISRPIGGRPLKAIRNTLPHQGCCVDLLTTPSRLRPL